MRSLIHKCIYLSLFIIISACGEKEKTPGEINVELQELELDIYEKIAKNQKDEALELLKRLIHPSDKDWKEKQKQTSWESFTSGGNQYYTYNEWWSERRNELRDLILGTGDRNNNQNTKSSQESPPTQKEPDNEKSKKLLLNEYVGTYSIHNNNGEIKFYKIINTTEGYSKILYQDNVGGNVNIKSFLLDSFEESTGKVIAVNEKNSLDKITLEINISTLNKKTITDQSSQVFVFE